MLNQIQKLVLGKFKKNKLESTTLLSDYCERYKMSDVEMQNQLYNQLCRNITEEISSNQMYRNLNSERSDDLNGKLYKATTYCFSEGNISELIMYAYNLGLTSKDAECV